MVMLANERRSGTGNPMECRGQEEKALAGGRGGGPRPLNPPHFVRMRWRVDNYEACSLG